VAAYLGRVVGEIRHQVAVEMRIVRHGARHDVRKQHDLGVGEQNAEFRPGQRLAARLALGQHGGRRQRLDRPVEQPARLQRGHEAGLVREVGQAAPALQRQRQRLLVIVGQHQPADFRRHFGEQLVARRPRQRSLAHGRGQRDLDVDLDVRRVDAARIVDRIGVAGAAGEAELDAPALGHA
jgi:hypothetical protein